MNREEALHEWKREVETWNKCSNLYPECKILYGEFAYFINILDAIIDPKDEYHRCDDCKKYDELKPKVTKPLPDTFSNISTKGVSTYGQDISTNQEFEKNQPTTCKVCLKKAYDNYETAWPTKCTCDDGWKPWPPKDWNDIKLGKFEISGDPQKGFHPWTAEYKLDGVYLHSDCPKELMKYWRQI